MTKKHYIAVLAILVVLIGINLFWTAKWEGFEVDPERIQPSCTVYYTSDVGGCDTPYTKNGVNVDYSYHREYYVRIKKALEERQKKHGNLSTAEAQQYATILEVLQQYDKFLDGQSCKISIPKWKQLSDRTEMVSLGDIQQNTQRGNPLHWAFCISAKERQEAQNAKGVHIEKDSDGAVYNVEYNEKQYVRGSFPNFDRETISALYCAETRDRPSQRFTGLQLDPYANTLRVMIDGKHKQNIDNEIVKAFVRAKFVTETVKHKNDVEEVYMVSNMVEAPVYKIKRDICDKDRNYLTRFRIKVMLTNMPDPIKRVRADEPHLFGTREELLARKLELIKQRDAAAAERERTRPLKDFREQALAILTKQVQDLERSIATLTSRINRMKRSQTGVAAGSAVYMVPGIGAVAGLAMAFASIGMAAQLAAWRKSRTRKINQLASLKRDCSTQQMLKACQSLQRYNCTPDEDCPKNVPMVQTMTNEAISAHQPFVDKVIMYDKQIKEITDWLKKMDDDILQYVTLTIQNGSFVLQTPPYEALSWDNKFYIQLL